MAAYELPFHHAGVTMFHRRDTATGTKQTWITKDGKLYILPLHRDTHFLPNKATPATAPPNSFFHEVAFAHVVDNKNTPLTVVCKVCPLRGVIREDKRSAFGYCVFVLPLHVDSHTIPTLVGPVVDETEARAICSRLFPGETYSTES